MVYRTRAFFQQKTIRSGFKVGTAITTLVSEDPSSRQQSRSVFAICGDKPNAKNCWRQRLQEPNALYDNIKPLLPLGLPFVQTAVSENWFDWPALPDLFPMSFPGVKTSRDSFLVDTNLNRLRARVGDYFDKSLSHDEIERRYPGVMKTTARFDARTVRESLMSRGGPVEDGFIRYAPIGRLTIAGFIGKRRQSYLMKSVPTTGHMCSRRIYGYPPKHREREAKEDLSHEGSGSPPC